jgi:mRNA-degrading endonuclease RelE of RelBE toxin-antitoxin system
VTHQSQRWSDDQRVAEPFKLDPDPAFGHDLEAIDPFHLGRIHRHIELLAYQARVRGRHRKDLKRPIPWCPDATSVIRVGDFRILYRVEAQTIHLLRLGLKVRERLLPVRIERGGRP